jgi:hypothetical protein
MRNNITSTTPDYVQWNRITWLFGHVRITSSLAVAHFRCHHPSPYPRPILCRFNARPHPNAAKYHVALRTECIEDFPVVAPSFAYIQKHIKEKINMQVVATLLLAISSVFVSGCGVNIVKKSESSETPKALKSLSVITDRPSFLESVLP